jgi:hypothetical protein
MLRSRLVLSLLMLMLMLMLVLILGGRDRRCSSVHRAARSDIRRQADVERAAIRSARGLRIETRIESLESLLSLRLKDRRVGRK